MQVRSSRSRSRSKRGVSPVIGVILMVAATIVIAGVVMGMLGGFGPPKSGYVVTATASENPATGVISVTYQGGPDSDMVSYITATCNGANMTIDGTVNGTSRITAVGGILKNTTSTTCNSGPNNDHVVAIATFTDGSKQVILDTYV